MREQRFGLFMAVNCEYPDAEFLSGHVNVSARAPGDLAELSAHSTMVEQGALSPEDQGGNREW